MAIRAVTLTGVDSGRGQNSTLRAAACGSGPAAGGLHVDGPRHGHWRIAHPEGPVEEGRYVAGRLHGEWVLRDAAGRVVARELWCHGRAAAPGKAVCE